MLETLKIIITLYNEYMLHDRRHKRWLSHAESAYWAGSTGVIHAHTGDRREMA